MAELPEDRAATGPDAPAGGREAGTAAQPETRSHTGRLLLWSLLAPLLLVLALVTGGLIWAGSAGSLATALRLAQAQWPALHARGVSGAILGSGHITHLTWEKDGLNVRVDELALDWSPRALLRRTLDVRRLSARRVVMEDRAPAHAAPASGPPRIPILPLAVRIEALRVDEIQWAGPPALTLRNLAARLATHGARYRLDVDRAEFDRGRYRARAQVDAADPMMLDVALAGALTTPAADGAAAQPVALQATLQGPVTRLLARVDVRVQAGGSAEAALPEIPQALAPVERQSAPATPSQDGTDNDAALRLETRITPWETVPLAEAQATLQAVDLGALLRQAPRTLLDGELSLQPGTAGSEKNWAIEARIDNRAAGPWDRHRLPIEHVNAQATWSESGGAVLETLKAELAGGTLEASGRFGPRSAEPQASEPGAAADERTGAPWQVEARLAGIHPARILTTLAGAVVNGSASAHGSAASPIRFNVALQAANGAARSTDTRAAGSAALDLSHLRLRNLDARGDWTGGWLTLERLRVKTDDAELAGRIRVRPAELDAIAGSVDLQLAAPGARATLRGELQPAQGAGQAAFKVSDAARLLAWARTLPGAAHALEGVDLGGTLDFAGQWRGGWRDPTLQARLATPRLTVRKSGGGDAAPVEVRDVDATLNGRLAEARLRTRGSARQGQRQIEWTIAADGGRTTPRATLADSSWRLNLTALQVRASDPALGAGTWQAATAGAVAATWARGALEVAPGELRITSPAPSSQARIAWQATHWRRGALQTSGRFAGVPMQWLEFFRAGSDTTGTRIAGNLVFDGNWDVQAARTLQARINVARAGGDLTLLATDAETGVTSRVTAGLRDAHVQLDVNGERATASALWDSERAGRVEATLQTQLSANPARGAALPWMWTENAPIQGRIQAHLPTISTWSILAPPGWRLRGAVSADIRIAGSAAEPQWSGTLSADQLALRSVVDGVQLQDGQLRAHLEGSRLVLDQFILHGPGADGSGGTVSATGEAGWIAGQLEARLATTLTRLRASVRSDRKVTVSGRLDTALRDRRVSATGALHVDHALIILPDSSRPALGDDVVVHEPGRPPLRGAADKAAPDAARAPSSPLAAQVDIQINLGDDFRLRGVGIDTRLAGTLALTSDGPLTQMPTLKGRVQTEGGRFQAYGQRLEIARGRLFFSGDVTNPGLDILALRPNYTSDQKVGVQVQGSALLPQVHLYSDPALPDNQTLAWLMLGHAAPENGGEAALMQSAALALLGGRESAGLAATFGLDELSFGQNTGAGQTGRSLTLGKRISERLYAAYEQGLGGATSVLMIFYELSKRWVIRGQTGASSAVDLIFKLSYD